jgi:uncharacterized protein YaiI (UPF0178 family)
VNTRTIKAIDMANAAIAILKERGDTYDANTIQSAAQARIMQVLYPHGLKSELEEIIKYNYISYIVDKLCRFRLNEKKDNLLDLANYAFLLAASNEAMEDK